MERVLRPLAGFRIGCRQARPFGHGESRWSWRVKDVGDLEMCGGIEEYKDREKFSAGEWIHWIHWIVWLSSLLSSFELDLVIAAWLGTRARYLCLSPRDGRLEAKARRADEGVITSHIRLPRYAVRIESHLAHPDWCISVCTSI